MNARTTRQRVPSVWLLILVVWHAGSADVQSQVARRQIIRFDRDIRPLLSEKCFPCHGPDEEQRQADLRLDLRADAFQLRDEGAAIVPGDFARSQLMVRIASDDADLRMPPADFAHQLESEQIELIRKWINQGAVWQEHWAFVSVANDPPMPAGEEFHPIDRFVAAELENRGWQFSPAASRRELIRRLSLDLTGLPATRDEIRRFLDDQSELAYPRLVDRLLSSPHFGERMAVAWLDQARYADTNGYSIDGGRHMWLWRDWVIQAYNQNMPFDQFAVEQLAGDLLPAATDSQKIASGFNRNHMITHEGGTISEENLVHYAVDRVKTTAEVFMGLTMGCAQCHDHKYDPITQRDFYRFFAFFNTLDDRGHDGDGGRNAVPRFQSQSVLQLDDVDELKSELDDLQRRLSEPLDSQREWERRARDELARRGEDLQLHPCRILSVAEPNSRGAFQVLDGTTVFVPRPVGRSPSISAKLPVDQVTALRLEFLTDDALPGLGHGQGETPDTQGGFVLTAFHASATRLAAAQVDPFRELKFKSVTASHSHPDFPPENCLDGRDLNGWSPLPEIDRTQSISFELERPIDINDTPYVTVMLVWGGGGLHQSGLMAGKYRLLAITGQNDQSAIPADVREILATAEASRDVPQQAAIRQYYNSIAPELANLRFQLSNLSERLRLATDKFDVMIMNSAAQPRKTHVLHRGQYDQPGDEVQPGIPSFLPALGFEESSEQNMDRLALAGWITDPQHPLTSRVAVNRLWQMLFGTGLVATSADFGSQGEYPTHPALLDWLARDLVEHDWDIKRAIRQMVMSRTYRQSSRSTPELNTADPDNRFLTRGPRFRLQAEFVRDLALSASGLLSPQIGGPSVRPYQPAGLWKEVSHYGSTPATAQYFVQDHGDKLYRRSLYTYWKRTAPPPSLTVFDAPNREVCTVRRSRTNTPLQALVLLNDPQFVEASRVLAGRIMRSTGEPGDRIRHAFEAITGRLPTDRELDILQRRFRSELLDFQQDLPAASMLLAVGEADAMEDLDPAEHAALTTVVNLIMNLSEAITRG